MDAFDRIIGYSKVKGELRQICDSLRNGEIYAGLGVKAPQGLLLYGEPGVGKTLMASALIEECGRPAFICRKDRPDGDFIKAIKETFDRAAEQAPSIVFLDDMDKFANGDEDHPDAEEYVTVQSCIDTVKGREVYVLATANDISALPRSLRRAGRFDRVIEIAAPRGEDAELITEHFLSSRRFVGDIDPKPIARIMDGRSTAELETVINQAGIYAGYERAEAISMEHFLRACLKIIFEMDADGPGREAVPYEIALHESGHAVVHEALCPGCVTLVCADSHEGFTHYYRNTEDYRLWMETRIMGSLAGMAAVEMKTGLQDWGSSSDLDQAFDRVGDLVKNSCVSGFSLHSNGYNDSGQLRARQEQAVSAEVEKYYMRTKQILAANAGFLEALARLVMEKGLLTMEDVSRVRDEAGRAPAGVERPAAEEAALPAEKPALAA
ncbi:MAG: AAA family ATPase [Firmicutes bacterium]|nr:AAA family ATPase [Bacillota bacterium]